MADTLQITEKLPPELLEKVFAYTSVPDILRLKQVGKQSDYTQRSQLNFGHPLLCQVNHYLRSFVQDSPYIKNRIDLFTAGLEDNPAVNLTLADKRKAFYEHRMKWRTLEPVKKWQRTIGSIFNTGSRATALGVYAFIADSKEFVEFITLESVSRGIPRKEWKLPLPDFALSDFAINPQADVLVVVVRKRAGEYTLHLLSMTSGQPHPAAENPIISYPYSFRPGREIEVHSISVTNSRLAILLGPETYGMDMTVWDWRTGRIVLQRSNPRYQQLIFVDEHWLALFLGSWKRDPSRLLIFDTERGSIMNPIETSFFFSSAYPKAPTWYISSEPCSHTPSPDELMTAPFYSDPSQRILAMYFGRCDACHIINIEQLLELAREQVYQEVEWEEWRTHAVEVPVGEEDCIGHIWVSGCRLFCTVSDGLGSEGDALSYLRVYGFGHAGRAKHLHALDRASEDGGTRWISPILEEHELPWDILGFYDVTVGHDSILFCVEDIIDGELVAVLHVWSL
ncbi:hypothetical protein BDM02DRAFT_3191141 [Thelephora ganbajun]|uniref:Uncharacterized protein n=1 Tax=Thelephora ganbajun TaxID=370292 RepID=A0ACB6Z2C0_THEGA|nr:hypothetical protein BDM02DRAFT_3191141 [Thelephora ganbajun]